MRAAAVAVMAAGAAAQAPGWTGTCKFSTRGSTFDLSTMTLPAGNTYKSVDFRDPTKTYFYNFCANVPTPQDPACQSRGSALSTAWQFDSEDAPNPSNCYRVGWDAPNGWNFTLYDQAKPAQGVVITYPGGDSVWCPNRNRTFSVEVLCAPVPPANPSAYQTASVFELNDCDYRLTVASVAGCPTACITGNTICSGNGICGYNTDAGTSQCFCNTGFGGASCGAATGGGGKGMSAEGVLLIIVCIVLAGVLGLVGFMFVKLRKLQVDPSAYGQLEGKFNELGMLA